MGDLAEVNALKKVFKDTSDIKMNGTKVRALVVLSLFSLSYSSRVQGFLACQKLIISMSK